MQCKKCNSEMKTGQVIAPVWGNVRGNLEDGQSLYSVGNGVLRNCMKCPICGYSKVLGNVYTDKKLSPIGG